MARKQNRTIIKAGQIEHLDVARVHNPRYLVSRDGEEVGIFPGFNALMAINAARKIYGPGKYSSIKTGEAMYLGRGALETERREREERTARAAAKAAAKRDKIQLPKKSRTRRNPRRGTRRNAEGWRNEYDGAFNSIIFGTRHKKVIDLGRRKRGAERDLVMAYADDLLQLTMKNVAALDDGGLLAELSSKARTSAQRTHRIDPTRAALLLDQAEEIMLGYRLNPASRQPRKISFKTNKRGQLQAFIYVMGGGISRWNRIGLEEARRRLATGEAVNVDFNSMLTPSTVGKTYRPSVEEETPINSKYINPAEKDAEHPIEVTRHFRGGPPGYLSPWQKAMAIGQAELFDTGIKLAPRAAQLRAARLSNPGATKPVYQSGLKQATAGQLPRLARVGLRVGHSPAEIRSDLAATGRFTAEQIRRAIDQATTAERRSNPTKRDRRNPASSWAAQVAESKRNFKRELKKNAAKANKLYALLLEYYASFGPEGAQRSAQIFIEDWLRKDIGGLKGEAFSLGLDYEIEKIEQSLEARRKNPPVKEIFETFNGRPATRATNVQAPRRTPARVAQLGRLRLIRTADGRTWRFPGERAPYLAADSRGKLHVVGGQYRANPAGEICGEIEQIEYQTSKPHLGHDSETIYYHQLGEETGERPILEITPEGELQIVGGDYRIEADGIHN